MQPCRKPGRPDEIDLPNFCTLSPVMMFFAMQRHFVAGLTFGATKG